MTDSMLEILTKTYSSLQRVEVCHIAKDEISKVLREGITALEEAIRLINTRSHRFLDKIADVFFSLKTLLLELKGDAPPCLFISIASISQAIILERTGKLLYLTPQPT